MKVPLIKQKKLTCGPTSLRMVAAYYGRDINEREVIKLVGGLKSYGVDAIALGEAANKLGFISKAFSYSRKHSKGKAKIKKPTTSLVKNALLKKMPVILLVRSCILFDKPISDKGHFIVVTGYKNGVYEYNDPKDGRAHTISEEELQFAWFNRVLDMSAYLIIVWPKK